MRNIARGIVAAIAVPCALLLAIIAIAAQFPRASLLTAYAAAFVVNFATHFLIAGLAALACALLAHRLGARLAGRIAIPAALLALALLCVPLVSIWRAAGDQHASLSLPESLRVAFNSGGPNESRSVTYATVDGQDLKLDVWLPPGQPSSPRPAVVWVHGGGWVSGARGATPHWNTWLTARGYAVFDIDYRLAPPPRWDQATGDVKCAIGWVKAHAADYGIDPQRVLVGGSSAGGNLALMAAYAAADPVIPPSCSAGDTSVAAVVALFPVTDATAWWHSDGDGAQYTTERYTGGTPAQFPDRYAAISPLQHIRPGLPPTFLAHGTADHIVPYDQSRILDTALANAGVSHTLVTLPRADHGYDLYWNSFGTQITRQTLATFLAQHTPPVTQPPQ